MSLTRNVPKAVQATNMTVSSCRSTENGAVRHSAMAHCPRHQTLVHTCSYMTDLTSKPSVTRAFFESKTFSISIGSWATRLFNCK